MVEKTYTQDSIFPEPSAENGNNRNEVDNASTIRYDGGTEKETGDGKMDNEKKPSVVHIFPLRRELISSLGHIPTAEELLEIEEEPNPLKRMGRDREVYLEFLRREIQAYEILQSIGAENNTACLDESTGKYVELKLRKQSKKEPYPKPKRGTGWWETWQNKRDANEEIRRKLLEQRDSENK